MLSRTSLFLSLSLSLSLFVSLSISLLFGSLFNLHVFFLSIPCFYSSTFLTSSSSSFFFSCFVCLDLFHLFLSFPFSLFPSLPLSHTPKHSCSVLVSKSRCSCEGFPALFDGSAPLQRRRRRLRRRLSLVTN